MKLMTLQQQLQNITNIGIANQRVDFPGNSSINVFSTKMLESYFPNEKKPAFRKTLATALEHGVLERVCRGVYVYPPSFSQEIYKLEKIAVILRMGGYSYLSLESALAEYGVISQLPLNRITVMTTGRKQTYNTPYGIIEFIHTNRSEKEIIEQTIKVKDRPLRLASVDMAYRDLQNVGRNQQMVNMPIYKELIHA